MKKIGTFREANPPELTKVLTISQPETDLICEHWRLLTTAIDWQAPTGQKHCFFLFKSKNFLTFLNFQDGCLLYQRKFKIVYASVQEITCLKLHAITIKFKDNKKREVLVAVGYHNGHLEIYHLCFNEKSIMLKRLLSFDFEGEAVTGFAFSKKNMIVTRLHTASVYKECLAVIASIIIEGESKNKDKWIDYKFLTQSLVLKDMSKGNALNISVGSSIYVFNETEGAKSFGLQDLKENGTIMDSITFFKEALNQTIVLGDTNDKLKIIYKNIGLIERYSGFKNYCSAAEHITFQTHQELWVGDLHGDITYFQRTIENTESKPEGNPIRLIDMPIKLAKRAIQSGIKELHICGKLLLIFDSESNIHIFDILRKGSLQDEREIEIQSVEEYSSES